ncbi:MAG TPA: hypothetical protein VLG67_00385 [Candidatus Saccharimonadales bacterium]|nr:hypothetical protein [Candidatus Saccharimonadales bacterium]
MFYLKRVLSLVLIIVFLLNINIVSVFAQSPTKAPAPVKAPTAPINLTLSPTFINLATDPGKEVSSQLRVTNNNAFTEYFKIDIAKYQVGSDGERLNIVPLDKNDEFGKWVTFQDPEFEISSNQTKTLKFTIAPPKEAALGYYYAFIIRRVTEQAGANTTVLTGAPAFTTVLEVRSPNAKRELQLVSFSTDQSFYEYLPSTFNVTFKNTGNIHIVPHGDIFIDQGSKKDIAILKINEGQGNILPGATRTYTATWDDALIARVPKMENGKELRDSKGNIEYSVKFDSEKPLSKFRIGNYKANLLSVYDNGKRDVPLESNLSFWVLPWKLIGIILIVIIGPVLLYHLISKRRKKK